MRAGICSIQLQALTPEAANTVKQALSLATRRGHAQITPLHVASAMLTTSSGLLRKACLQCHSHPLQCKALELCFNVALNRLPASTPTPLLGPHYNNTHGISNNTPSLSNALVAAFKRAQSHQRRGSIEAQNQSILALKIEVEQLVISILDDPSVSRVMREAGFSSSIVKSKVEQSVVSIVDNHPNPKPKPKDVVIKSDNYGGEDDVASVVNLVMNRRRNVVIVGESVVSGEVLAKRVNERLGISVVSVPIVSFRNIIRKEEVERKIMELRCIVKSHVGRGGIVLYLGDLEWLLVEMMMKNNNKCFYSSVEHMVMEVKRLISEGENNNGRVWLMGVSSFKTYIKCKSSCQPSLETLWDLHPFTIPVPTLSLSLNINYSDVKSEEKCFEDRGGVRKNLSCCRDCTVNFEKEAQSLSMAKKEYCTATVSSTSTTLPSWFQNFQESERLKDLCKKWNSFCNSVHHRNPQAQYLMISPSSSSKTTSFATKGEHEDDVVCYESSNNNNNNLIMFIPNSNTKPDLLSNPNSSPNSASSSEANLDGLDTSHVFTDPSEENLKILCDALEKKVGPQYKHVVHEISSTVLRCRSKKNKQSRQDTWMVFSCNNDEQVQREGVSRELAKAVFGSYTNFVMISSYDDDEKKKKMKRVRNNDENVVERFGEALNENPHRVFFFNIMEDDLEGIDGFSHKCIKEAIQSGSLRLNGELVPLKDAIVIFSCERSTINSPQKKKKMKMKKNKDDDDDDDSLCLDLNIAINEDGDDDKCNFLELVDKNIVFKTQEGDIN